MGDGTVKNFTETASGLHANKEPVGELQLQLQVRDTWANKLHFLLSCIGYAVGLGNVWRFPYLCYSHGGGAFLIPYFLFAVTAAVPLFMLEVALGQITRQGPLTVWNICPAVKGIGMGMSMLAAYSSIYYIVILAWSLVYLYDSFNWKLPWGQCHNDWNTDRCNGSDMAVKEYWNRRILMKTSGLEEIGEMQLHVVLALAVAWVAVFLCICRGVRTSGRVAYVTATFPYAMLLILMVRGVTLPGAMEGIRFYMNPDFSRLTSSVVWYDAASQVMYTYGLAIGAMIALGSYNQPSHAYVPDCLIIAACNTSASLMGGLAIFGTLGFMAKMEGRPIDQVATGGPGLAFEVYPRALIEMPAGPIWAIVFFSMILMIGIDSQFVCLEGLITGLVDQFPHALGQTSANRRTGFLALVCVIFFLLGVPMCLGCGIYIFQLLNYYAYSGIVLMTFCLAEISAIAYGQPLYKFVQLHFEKSGRMPSRMLQLTWLFVTPTITLSILLFSIVRFEPLRLDDYVYPPWALAIGLTMTASSLIPIPINALVRLCVAPGNGLRQKWAYINTEQK